MTSLAVFAAKTVRLPIVYAPPRRRGLRLAATSERWFGVPDRALLARHESGYLITCDLRDPVQRSLFYRGTYEPGASALVRQALLPGDTFVDVGANAGHYTFLAARAVGPAGAVHAIEASRATADALGEDVRRNGLTQIVTVYNVAAADVPGRLVLDDPDGPTSSGTRRLGSSLGGPGLEMVDVVTLDALLAGVLPSVIKLDVEGADLRALVGLQKTIESARPRLVVAEADGNQLARFGDSVEALEAYMTGLGYVSKQILDPGHASSLAFTPRS